MSEDYLDEIMSSRHVDRSKNIYFAHAKSTGGVIPGEVKLASALQILGGDLHGHGNDFQRQLQPHA